MTAPTKAREGGGRTRYVPTHALSIRQPWAWLIVHGYKDVENRTWRTDRRGPIWIHTGKTFDLEGYQWVRMNMPDVPLPHRAAFELGVVTHLAVRTASSSDIPWAAMQRIKNELMGRERTAVEVFPAESELVDEANMYHLWVLPEGMVLPFSLGGRP